jgi:hypothetical protein
MEEYLIFIKVETGGRYTSIQTYIIEDIAKLDNLKFKYSYKPDEFYGESDMDGSHTINVLLIEDVDRCHALLVTNTEKLTGCKICPKCHNDSFNVLVKQYNYKYNIHVERCDGNPPAAKLRLEESKPFTKFLDNKTYAYFMARNRLNEFKPTQYFLCFDYETFEEKKEKTEESNTMGSTINAVLRPFNMSIAYANKSKIDAEVFDCINNGDDFSHECIIKMFKYAEEIARDNMYPQNIKAEKIREDVRSLIYRGCQEILDSDKELNEMNQWLMSKHSELSDFEKKIELIKKEQKYIKEKEFEIPDDADVKEREMRTKFYANEKVEDRIKMKNYKSDLKFFKK